MRAVILAAGLSSRMAPLTKGLPKCLLPLHGKPLLQHQLDQLKSVGIDDIVIVTGNRAEAIREAARGQAEFRHYPNFAKTNNLMTLYHSVELLSCEVVVLFSDVLIAPQMLARLISAGGDYNLLVDTSRCDPSTMRILLEGDRLVDIGSHIPVTAGHGNFVGISHLSRRGADSLAEQVKRLGAAGTCLNEYYTKAFVHIAQAGGAVRYVDTAGKPWMELDEPADYEAARQKTFFLSSS